MRKVILGLLAVAACSSPNPDSCCATAEQCLQYGFPDITPCQDNTLVCNVDGACVTPQCRMDSDCNDPSKVCDAYGECVDSSQASQFTLTVQIRGSGVGSVTSSPAGIACTAGTCMGVFDAGTQVTLTQSASTGSFLGWTNACGGVDACTVTLANNQKVGALFGTDSEVLWARDLGAVGQDYGHSVLPLPDGDVIAAGEFRGSMILDTFNLQSPDDQTPNAFVATLDGLTGQAISATSLPIESINAMVIDGDSIYAAGEFTGSITLGGSTFTAVGGDEVVFKMDTSGTVVWAMSVGGSADTAVPTGIAIKDGVVAFSGHTNLAVTIGGTTTTSSDPIGYVVGVDSGTGAVKWSHAFAGSGSYVTPDTIVAGSDAFLVSGLWVGTIDFGAGSLAAAGANDGYIARFNSSTGTLAQFDHWGGSGANVEVTAVAQVPMATFIHPVTSRAQS